jgi:peptidoglycan biosynthesis protein MviN/MurJ (putative lipid II flippase)
LATSLASILNLVLLLRVLSGKLGPLGWRQIIKSGGKTIACSLVMGIAVWMLSICVIPAEGGNFFGLLLGIAVSIGIGTLLYGAFSFLLKSPELEHIMSVIFDRGHGRGYSLRQMKSKP